MKCIVVDDEPLAREGIRSLIENIKILQLVGTFSNAGSAAAFLAEQQAGLVFLDVQMPGINGIDFAKNISGSILVIFTTAYTEYALDSYEADAIDYLVKPIEPARFEKAVNKALSYHALLQNDQGKNNIEKVTDDYFFIRADRRIFKVFFNQILYIEGLNNYVMIHTVDQKIITAMNVKVIYEQLPGHSFVRVSKSYIVNIQKIDSFDNNTVFIRKEEIPIGNAYRNYFFDRFVNRKLLGR